MTMSEHTRTLAGSHQSCDPDNIAGKMWQNNEQNAQSCRASNNFN